MHRIDSPSATVDKKFTNGSPAGGVPATVVTAEWLNDLQENVAKAIEAAGIPLVKGDFNQLANTLRAFGGYRNSQVYLTAGVSTWAKPSGTTRCFVIVIGGGGGAGRSDTPGVGSGGGGGGGVVVELCDVSAVASVSVTVGSAGIGRSVSEGAGTDGGSSSFGSFCSATGGEGGQLNLAGGGGIGFGGTLNMGGSAGGFASGIEGGTGGGGGPRAYRADGNSNTSTVPGGGGAGARATFNGGSGAPGAVVILW